MNFDFDSWFEELDLDSEKKTFTKSWLLKNRVLSIDALRRLDFALPGLEHLSPIDKDTLSGAIRILERGV